MKGWFDVLNWIRNKIADKRKNCGYYKIDELQAGGHCGLCGAWMPNAVVPKEWTWDMCDKHIKE